MSHFIKWLWFSAVLVATLLSLPVNSSDCSFTDWSYDNTPCPDGNTEIYRDEYGKQTTRRCCDSGSAIVKQELALAKRCRVTDCLSSSVAGNPCSNLYPRYINNKKLEFEAVLSDSCSRGPGGGFGTTALCCPLGGEESKLVSTMGAESNEFPHQAKLKMKFGTTQEYHCGGTVYNKNWIVTASHCIVQDGYKVDPAGIRVILGSNIADMKTEEYMFHVSDVIPHYNYSKLAGNAEFEDPETGVRNEHPRNFNDVALLRLKKSITFSDKIKALEIASTGFDPFKFADNAVIIGWGTTDTMRMSPHLQKVNVILRRDDRCLAKYSETFGMSYAGLEKKYLCVGGVLDGQYSMNSGGGDSGGPAVCRKEDGTIIQCGITSFGTPWDEECVKEKSERYCLPSVYAEVPTFAEWISETTQEPQDPTSFYKPFLYGRKVSKGEYEHQVHITSNEGKPCGGTLIASDIVVTAAQCVMNSDGSGASYTGLRFTPGLNNLNEKGKSFGLKNFIVLPGFERYGEPVDPNADAVIKSIISDNYYVNDLAVVKMNGKANINSAKLPVLPEFGDRYYTGEEIAFPRSEIQKGELRSREFKLLDKMDCQKRMNRVGANTNVDLKVGDNILCGVENYSGGSTCDRELGGGLICRGKDGKQVLCGVQMFRLCRSSIPNGFMDMALYGNWIKRQMQQLNSKA